MPLNKETKPNQNITFIWFQILLCITNHSIQHQSFVYTVRWSNSFIWKNFNFASAICLSYSSCRAASTDFPHPTWPPVSIIHRSRKVFQATSRIDTVMLYINSCWSSKLCSSIWRGPLVFIAFEFFFTFPVVCRISGSSNLDIFRDGW